MARFRRLDQACRFVHRIRDRFLDQHRNAVLYTLESMLDVQGIWGSHDDAVRALRIEHIGEDRICRHTGLSCEVGRAEGRVDYGGELAGSTIPDQLDMVAPDQACAHHRDMNSAHNLTRRGFAVSMKRSPLSALWVSFRCLDSSRRRSRGGIPFDVPLAQSIDGEQVDAPSQPRQVDVGHLGEDVVTTPFLAGMNVREVRDREIPLRLGQGIPKRESVVGEPSRVANDGVGLVLKLLEPVYERSLGVGLKMDEVASQLACLFVHLSLNISERARTVDLGLAKAKTVQVGPLKDNDSQSDTLLSRFEGHARHRTVANRCLACPFQPEGLNALSSEVTQSPCLLCLRPPSLHVAEWLLGRLRHYQGRDQRKRGGEHQVEGGG